jgi:hypothetical protein
MKNDLRQWLGNFKIDQRWEVENSMKHGEFT